MAIDAQRLDEILAEFARQHASLRERLARVTAIHEITGQVKEEFSRTTPDASRVRVFMMSSAKMAEGRVGPLPPGVALTEAETQVVRARLPELEALTADWQQIIADTTQRLLRGPAAQPAPAAPSSDPPQGQTSQGPAAPFDAARLDAYLAGLRERIDGLRARMAAQARALYQQEFGAHERADADLYRLKVLSTRVHMENAMGGAARPFPMPLPPELQADPGELAAIRARLPEIQALLKETTGVLFERLDALASPADSAGSADPPAPPSEADAATIRPEDPEALAWLRENPGEAPLAANRFDAPSAREFVESLYRAGARRVVIASECIRDDEDPAYADGVRVELPDDPARRGAVLDLVNREMAEEGFDAEPDRGQPVVFLWWD